MSRYAIVNTTSGIVENVIDYDEAPSTPPAGFAENYLAVQSDTVSTGWTYSNGALAAPSITPVAPTIQQQIMALEIKQTDRMVRETLTNATNVFPAGNEFTGLTSAQALAQLQTQIAALRATLTAG